MRPTYPPIPKVWVKARLEEFFDHGRRAYTVCIRNTRRRRAHFLVTDESLVRIGKGKTGWVLCSEIWRGEETIYVSLPIPLLGSGASGSRGVLLALDLVRPGDADPRDGVRQWEKSRPPKIDKIEGSPAI